MMLRTLLCCLFIIVANPALAEETPITQLLEGRKFFTIKPQHRTGGNAASISAVSAATAMKPLVPPGKNYRLPKRSTTYFAPSDEKPPSGTSSREAMSREQAQQLLAIFPASE